MAIIVVNRVKYDPSADHRPRMREIAAIAKRHGAVSMRAGRCLAGPYTGQVVSAITFPDGAGFGRALDSMLADPEYQRFVAEVVKDSELQDRWIIVGEEF